MPTSAASRSRVPNAVDPVLEQGSDLVAAPALIVDVERLEVHIDGHGKRDCQVTSREAHDRSGDNSQRIGSHWRAAAEIRSAVSPARARRATKRSDRRPEPAIGRRLRRSDLADDAAARRSPDQVEAFRHGQTVSGACGTKPHVASRRVVLEVFVQAGSSPNDGRNHMTTTQHTFVPSLVEPDFDSSRSVRRSWVPSLGMATPPAPHRPRPAAVARVVCQPRPECVRGQAGPHRAVRPQSRTRWQGTSDRGTAAVDDCRVLPLLRRRTADPVSPAAHVRRPRLDYESNATGWIATVSARSGQAGLAGRPRSRTGVPVGVERAPDSEALNADIGHRGWNVGNGRLTITEGREIVTIHRTRTAVSTDASGNVKKGRFSQQGRHRRLDRHAATRIVKRLARHAGIERRSSPHLLRHSFITAALDARVALRDVQEAASHADPRTTMRYDRARRSLDRNADLHRGHIRRRRQSLTTTGSRHAR